MKINLISLTVMIIQMDEDDYDDKYNGNDLFGFVFGKNNNYAVIKRNKCFELVYNDNKSNKNFTTLDNLFDEFINNINEIKQNL